MEDFLKFMEELGERFPFHMDIHYSKIMDWCIVVYKEGCASSYPRSRTTNGGRDALICDVQDCDMALCFARAHVAVKEWLLENEGGY